MIGFNPLDLRPHTNRLTARRVSPSGKAKANRLTRTPLKFRFWKKG